MSLALVTVDTSTGCLSKDVPTGGIWVVKLSNVVSFLLICEVIKVTN